MISFFHGFEKSYTINLDIIEYFAFYLLLVYLSLNKKPKGTSAKCTYSINFARESNNDHFLAYSGKVSSTLINWE